MKQNVFIDTDVCDDIDDLWALVLAFNVSQFNILGISLAMGDTREKAKFVAKMLSILNRRDIPIFVGAKTNDDDNFHQEYYQDFVLDDYQGKIYEGMEQTVALFDEVNSLTILAMAPLSNIKSMYELSPSLNDKAKLVVMGGSIYKGYLFQNAPNPEYNILMDLQAANYVFETIKNCTLVPLDVCREFIIKGKKYDLLKQSNKQDIKFLFENFYLWNRTYIGGAIKFDPEISSTILYDVVTIIYVLHPEFFEKAEVAFNVLDSGLTEVSESGAFHVNCLVDWLSKGQEYEFVVKTYLGE